MASVNLKATVSTLVPAGTPSPLRISSPQLIRGSSILPSSLATDLDNITRAVNNLHTNQQTTQTVNQILLTNAAGQVMAAFGQTTYKGVLYTNFLSEIHVGDPLLTNNPNLALFNANLDGSVSIGQNGWLDVHDPFDGNAAWIGTQFDSTVITGASNNGSGLIRLQVPGHSLVNGSQAQVRVMNIWGVPNANGTWFVDFIDANTVDLRSSVWAGVFGYTEGTQPTGIQTQLPTIDRVLQVSGAVSLGGLIELTTSIPHTYETGDRVNVPGVPGMPAATGQWTIIVIDATNFTLKGSVFAGAFTGNGTCLRYFAGVLAQTIAIGLSFQNYNLRGFADGTLRIKNANIELTAGGNSIVLNPVGPSIDLVSAAGEIVLNAATVEILLTNTANTGGITLDAVNGQIILKQGGTQAGIILDATVPQITMTNGAGTVTITISPTTGTIQASAISSAGGFTGPVVVRNAAGSGTSTLTFAGGLLTAYAP